MVALRSKFVVVVGRVGVADFIVAACRRRWGGRRLGAVHVDDLGAWEAFEDLILAAYADAKGKADRLSAEKMQSLAAGLPLPPGMKLPF